MVAAVTTVNTDDSRLGSLNSSNVTRLSFSLHCDTLSHFIFITPFGHNGPHVSCLRSNLLYFIFEQIRNECRAEPLHVYYQEIVIAFKTPWKFDLYNFDSFLSFQIIASIHRRYVREKGYRRTCIKKEQSSLPTPVRIRNTNEKSAKLTSASKNSKDRNELRSILIEDQNSEVIKTSA